MATTQERPQPPLFSSTPESSATDSSRTDQKGNQGIPVLPPSLLPLADHRANSARLSATVQRVEGSAASYRIHHSEWAFQRYWSDNNPFPDYGSPDGGSTMNKLAKISTHIFGNFLNTPSREPDGQSSLAKRPSESTLTHPPKRPRRDNGPRPAEVISVDGTSDTLEMDRSADSAIKRKTGRQGSQSLRSSDNRHSSGAIDEYRSTSVHAGLGAHKKRSRHHKKGPASGVNGHSDQETDRMSSHKTTEYPPFKAPKRRLVSQSEYSHDRIEDDEPELTSAGAQSAQVTGRGSVTFTKSLFAPVTSSSEDELSVTAPQRPRTKMRDRMSQPAKVIDRRDHTNNGLKRSAESPDVMQDEHPAKRRQEPSRDANIQRLNVSSSARGSARGCPDVLLVTRAACLPEFAYPAEGMLAHAPVRTPNSTNKKFFLAPSRDGPEPWTAIDDKGANLPELWWTTPKISQISTLSWKPQSSIVKISKSINFASVAAAGKALFIEFGTPEEANEYYDKCLSAGSTIKHKDVGDLAKELEHTMFSVRQCHQRKGTSLPPDMQLAAQPEDSGSRRGLEDTESAPPKASQFEHYTENRTLRTQMRAEHGHGNSLATIKSQGRLPRPTEQRQIEEICGDDKNDNEQADHRSRRPQESQSRSNGQSTSPKQRMLRSVKPRARSPTPPPPERWTDKNPNWQVERNYSIPLIYERTTINSTDIERLDEGQFLNDEIISFYAKYLHKNLEARNVQTAKKIYVFSSFFWEKLRSSGYDGVKNWTTKIDVSSFDYIVVPINQNAHWYLAIICNPGGLLPKGHVGQDDDPVHPIAVVKEHLDGVSAEGEPGTKVETITTSLAHINFDEQTQDKLATIDLEDPKTTPSAKKPKAVRKGAGLRKYDPKLPRVIVLDSLDGTHSSVATTLKNYLKKEIKQRKNVDIDLPQQFGMAAKDIPFQTNFTDCGVYLLGYLEEFMKDPHEFTRKILQQESRTWDVNASAMRNQIRELIFELQSEYQRELKRQKREKMLASKQKRAKSQTPPAAPQVSPPSVASEQPVQRSPVGGSSISKVQQKTSASTVGSPIRHVEAREVLDQRSATISPPPVQREQISSRQIVAKSGQLPSSDHEATDVNESMMVNPSQDTESKESAPLQQEQSSSSQSVVKLRAASESSSSSDNGSGPLNVNASMIVHPNRSMESQEARDTHRDQSSSSQAGAKPGQVIEASRNRSATTQIASTIPRPIKTVEVKGPQVVVAQELPPRPSKIMEAAEVVGQVEPSSPSSSKSPVPHTIPRHSESPSALAGNYDERSFLRPIPSSPPLPSPQVQSSMTSKDAFKRRSGRYEAQSAKASAKHASPRQHEERSRYWSSERQSSTMEAPVRRSESFEQMVVPSSSVEEERTARNKATSKKEGKRSRRSNEEKKGRTRVKSQGDDKQSEPSPTIDLTTD